MVATVGLTIAPIREEGAQNDGHVGGERAGGAYVPWGRLFLAGLEVLTIEQTLC